MDAHLHQKCNTIQDHVKNNKNPKEEEAEKKQKAEASSSPPPSKSSSPAHEFSFAISFQSLSSSSSSSKPNPTDRTNKIQQSPFALDLSPADDIFFHGHLLPLHLLSHLPVSPRTSTNSLEGFTLPVKDLLQGQTTKQSITDNNNDTNNKDKTGINGENRVKNKTKSFSLFGLSKWRKGFEHKGEETEDKEKNRKKVVSLHLSHTLKKYMRLLFHKKKNDTQFRRQAHSFSSASIMSSRRNDNNNNNNNNNYRRNLRGRRGEFSAPASMRTSPTNSGHLLVSTGLSSSCSCSASDSTMEELQAAIQAAIAHCKNSIAVEDKIKC